MIDPAKIEELSRRFGEIGDRIALRGLPHPDAVAQSPDDILRAVDLRLERMEQSLRSAGFVWARGGRTTGVSGGFALADSFRLPLTSSSVTIVLRDAFGGWVQFANEDYPEWAMEPIMLNGPLNISLPIRITSFRIRALDDGGVTADDTIDEVRASPTQAEYLLLALGDR